MKKIVITGGIGYIGTELCKLYSKESHVNEIIVIDNRFLSERVKQLQDWGIHFIHGDILNEELMKDVLKDSDIVYHLAGITDVAHLKGESDEELDNRITKIGVTGSLIIINNLPQKTKIVFPSTHVIFEGYNDVILNIDENYEPKPLLAYSIGKYVTEKDLQNSNINYVILRLGSNYGYSNDSMRMNIMPNIFAKIAAQNGTIKLFSGGKQHKSLVAVFDVVRCMKFVGENNNINRELFNCNNENVTIKDVAEICKKINPNVNLIETDDEVPNLGYTMLNQKLLNTGFEFKFNLRQCIREMIKNWSYKRPTNTALEYKIQGEKEFIDERGRITNHELYEPVNWIGTIFSKKGTMRANHWHPLQTQQALVISGQYISVIKDLSDPKSLVSTQLINKYEIAVTKPNVAHTMVFTQDTTFLNLVNGEREHENYGVHTVPYKLVDEKLKNDLLKSYKEECRCCNNKSLKRFLNLGLSPLANNLINDIKEESDFYPLELDYCPNCHNVQLSYSVPSEKMFDNYFYVSSTTKTFVEHFKNAAEKYIEKYNLDENSLVIDIGSNDGIALKPFKEKGIRVLGIEPAKNIAKIANDNGIETINDYFRFGTISRNYSKLKSPNLILASNVFAHSDELKLMAKNAIALMTYDNSYCRFIIEVQYFVDVMKNMLFDNIYHEHFNYWTVTSLKYLFDNLGVKLLDVEHIDTHGGSIRVYIGLSGEVNENVNKFLEEEKEYGILDFSIYENFATNVELQKNKVNEKIKKLKEENNVIVGYGAPAKATTLLNYYNISKEIDYIVEDNKLKHNKYVPGVNIPIYSKNKLYEKLPDVVLVFAWNFIKEIKENNKDLIDKGVKFISIKEL